jgi:uncharacterized membrane protein
MPLQVLYCGDTSLQTAASYLAGILQQHGMQFEHVASDVRFTAEQLSDDCQVLILSDYMSSMFTSGMLEQIVDRTRAGMGLLMIGGWESFVGAGGDYHRTPLADILPVVMQASDDRVNSFAPCMIRPAAVHAITAGLPFAESAAAINGYNQWQAKAGATTVLSLQRYAATYASGEFDFAPVSLDPLLVVSQADQGRIACYAGDCAPHWAGGFVDWGNKRQVLQAAGAEEVEVGNWYVEFFARLVKWCAKDL